MTGTDVDGSAGDALAALIVRSATDFAIVTSDADGIIASWSPGAEKVMGWTADEAIGQPVDLFFTPEDVAAGRPDIELACARDRGCATDERWHMKRDGSRFWASGEMQPLRDGSGGENGKIVGYLKILRDRTEQHELGLQLAAAKSEAAAASERLTLDEARLREMFEAAPGFIAVLRGPELIYELVNASYQKLVNGRAVIGGTLAEAVPEVVGQGYIEKLQAAMHGDKSLTEHAQPIMLQQQTGAAPELHYLDYVFQPMHNASGVVTGLFLEGFDVTEAVLAREAATQLSAEQSAILGQLGEGVIATDTEGRITFVNAAAERLHGVARLDVEPDAYSDTYQLLTEDGDPYPPLNLPLARAVRDGETVIEARWRIRRPDGTEVLAIGNARPVVAGGRQIGAVLTVRDDTARTRAEAGLEENRAYLQLLLDSTQEAFYSVDTEGVTQVCNPAFVRMLGFERAEDAVGRTLHDVIHHSHPDGRDYAVADCPIYQCAKTGMPAHIADELFYQLDGTAFPVDYHVAPILRDGVLSGAICNFTDITEQRRTERALSETEERYRLAGRATNDAIWDWDLATNQVRWNEALQTAFGYELDQIEATGDWWMEHIHPEDVGIVDTTIHAAIDGTGSAWTGEYRFRRGNGSYADVLDRGTVIRDANGRATRMIGAMLDLTQRKAAETARLQSEDRYRTLFDAIDSGFCVLELKFDDAGKATDYRFIEVNQAFERQTGLVNAAGKWIRDIAPGFEQFWIDIYGGVASTRVPARHVDHSPALGRWFDVNAFPVDEPSHNRIAVLFNDISDQKRSELALIELNRTLETRVAETVAERDMIWQTSQDLFVVIDPDDRYVSVNPAWTEALGYMQDELIGMSSRALVHPDDAERVDEEFLGGARARVVKDIDVRVRHKDGGYRWFSWTAVPHADMLYAAGRDVTQRKELEDQLRQSQKMEAVGQLTGGIAHDFNNLLTIVSGNIAMALRSLGEDGDARALRSLGNAAKGAERAAALTQRLLAFSRRQPLQPRATDVNKLVNGMTELLDRALGETVDLQVVAGAGLWRVEVDPNQLENAILNLAVNARDAMPGGGKLTIETTNAHIDDAYAAAQREVSTGQYVLISVTDTGEGMPPNVVAKAFDPFFSTKEVGKGTGLGLSQVYGYVKQSGGHVKIYSEAGQGTTIKLYLPRLIADMHAAEEEKPEAGPALQGQESILVVEDDDDVRIYTVDSLRELGYRVLEAHDGASALRLLERQEESPRLLLTDVVMPGMSGRELADQARETWPDMRILFTTGYARNAIVHGGRLDAGVELLPKPFTFEALAIRVREVLEKGTAERALIIDAGDRSRARHVMIMRELGFAAEEAGTVREALGKLRAGAETYDIVMLSDALPVGNLNAVVTEIHAIRSDLPILIASGTNTASLRERYAGMRCVDAIGLPTDASTVRERLTELRVNCAT